MSAAKRAAWWWLLSALPGLAGAQPAYDRGFERELYKTRLEHEVKFRAAAIQVAWGAEALCHATTQIEPFVLLSSHAMQLKLSDRDLKLFTEVTGIDERWRVVWADEGAPDELKLGDVVVAVNDRPLPASGTRLEVSALFRGGAVVTLDDQGFWDVMLQARQEAAAGKPMRVTLASGRKLQVETQTGCAGSVTASAFDNDPDTFWRLGTQRAKIPANAMLQARERDEFRWLAAFGTYFQASQSAIAAVQKSEGMSTGFLVGKILSITVPGMGMLLSAAEAQADKAIAVDGIVGSADLFANEVVASLGGDPLAGLRLSERLLAQGIKAEAVLMDDFRRSNAAEHARRIKALQAAQTEREQAETRLQGAPSAAPKVQPARAPRCRCRLLRGWEFFGRARKVRENAHDLGAKHSHSSRYGEHLQRRARAFWRARRAWVKDSQPLRRRPASPAIREARPRLHRTRARWAANR